MKTRLLLFIAFFALLSARMSATEQLWVGQTYQCFMEDYADMSLSWVNISWSVDYGLYENYSGSYVRTVSFSEYKSGTYNVTVKWTQTDMSDSFAPFYHKSHTWSFTCRDNPLNMSQTSIELAEGDTKQLNCSFTYNNNYTQGISYKSSNPNVATVSTSGLVTAKAAGTAIITASSASSKNDVTCTIIVTSAGVKVTSVSLNKSTMSLQVGEKETLTATVKPDDAANKSVTWSSSNTSVTAVSSSGQVEAKAIGSATITCKANDGSGVSASCSVTVIEQPIDPTGISIVENLTMKLEDVYTIPYTLSPSNATTTVTWDSDNKSVATISSDGKVTPVSTGTATIIATTSNGLTASCKLTVIDNVKPLQVSIDKIFTGDLYSMMLKTDKSLWAWGCNTYRRLGVSGSDRLTPVKVADGVTYVAAESCNMILRTDGSLWVVGYIPTGLFTDISWDTTTFPGISAKKVMEGVASVAVAEYHIHILKQDGSLWACGQNVDGVLGDGTTEKKTTPVKVMDDVKNVFAGYHHMMALKKDGSLWAWGQNKYGQLGDGTTERKLTPIKLMDGGVDSVAAGCEHTMILKTDGTLWACGNNNFHGQLGDGTTTRRITPVQVMSGVKQVSSTWLHTMILKTDGSLWACGYNEYGQLGNNTTTSFGTPTSTPVKVMDGVASVKAATCHTIILKTDGSLWACGDNRFGQLGDGTTVPRSTPIKIAEYGEDVVAEINATNFPDEAFRNWLLERNYGKDGKLTEKEISSITSIDVSGTLDSPGSISSLKGIEFFTALKSLYCDYNKLTSLDVSKNTALTTLHCYNNQLTSLDVSKNTALTSLLCYRNLLTSLDVSKNTALTYLACQRNNLIYLDISKNLALKTFAPGGNPLKEIDVSNNTELEGLYCFDNQLTHLDVSKNTKLTVINCYRNSIKGKAMDDFINSLPTNTTSDAFTLSVYNNTERDEGNVMTKSQVAAAKAKGWMPKYHNGTEMVEYEGSDEESALKGDVNQDNAVNGTDLVALSNIVLGRKEQTAAADVNGDGSVNGTDIVALSNIILGRSNAPRRAPSTSAYLSVDESFDIKAGEEKELLINLTNPQDEITLVQFDLHLPTGLSIKKSGSDLDFDIAGRTSWRKHTLDASEVSGAYRFLLYSSSNTLIEGTSGAIIKLTVVADNSFSGGKIVIDNTLLVSPDEKETKPEAYEYTIGGGETPDDGSAKLSIEPFDIMASAEKELLIDLTNPQDEITLVQFDLHLPTGLSIKKSGNDLDFDIAGRTTWRKHTLDASEVSGAYRFLLYSSSNTLIEGTSGAIIKVTVVADNSFSGGKIVIDNTLLVSPDEKETKPAAYEYTIGEGTGISTITMDATKNAPIYNLSGQRLTTPQKGINIINGKKVVIK